ncbi:hypothetical protein [Dactylosporangium salmoneum]|uniref:Uncharacterized protein n=1 Tax=Dactylosporangium salmoneum TaxID=53361 RepID=A0ABN3HEW9_9ACTN
MHPRTYTQTLTYTRVGAIADQVQHLLRISGAGRAQIDRILQGMRCTPPDIAAVGVFCLDGHRERVLEIVLAVDWEAHAQYVQTDPNLTSNRPGWDLEDDLLIGPEAYLAGDRLSKFLRQADSIGEEVRTAHWVQFTPRVLADAELHRRLCALHGLEEGTDLPAWRGGEPREQAPRQFEDLPELSLTQRHAARRQ